MGSAPVARPEGEDIDSFIGSNVVRWQATTASNRSTCRHNSPLGRLTARSHTAPIQRARTGPRDPRTA